MSPTTQVLGEQLLAAGWDVLRRVAADPAARSGELLDLLRVVDRVRDRLDGLRLALFEEARHTGIAGAAVLDAAKHSVRTTTKTASAELRLATALEESYPHIGAALRAGEMSKDQAAGIVAGLRCVPLTRSDAATAQATVLPYTAQLGPVELRKLAQRAAELTDPSSADDTEAARLAREEHRAHRRRFIHLAPDFHGSVKLSGSLPAADAELLRAHLDALMPPTASYQTSGEEATPGQRRADALLALTRLAATSPNLPQIAGARPTVHVTIPLATLTTALTAAELITPEHTHELSPGEARRLACDAQLIPAVLGTNSQILDLGRSRRLVTPELRTGLILRDKGCAFPSCTAPAATCEAHHITPWHHGGPTSLENLVLLCPYHHRLIEPNPQLSRVKFLAGFSWFRMWGSWSRLGRGGPRRVGSTRWLREGVACCIRRGEAS